MFRLTYIRCMEKTHPRITLDQWKGENPETYVTGADVVRVYADCIKLSPLSAWNLFHLEDWVVSSATGTFYTLVKRVP